MALICSALTGIGLFLSSMTVMAMMMSLFPEKIGLVVGIATGLDAVGSTLSSPFAGLFYVIGGFPLPFFIVGSILAILYIVNAIFLYAIHIRDGNVTYERVEADEHTELLESRETITIWKALKTPKISYPIFNIFTVMIYRGVIESMTAPYMNEIGGIVTTILHLRTLTNSLH